MATTAVSPSPLDRNFRQLSGQQRAREAVAPGVKRKGNRAKLLAAMNEMRDGIMANLGDGDWQMRRNLPVFDENDSDSNLEAKLAQMKRGYAKYLPKQGQQPVTNAPTVTNAPGRTPAAPVAAAGRPSTAPSFTPEQQQAITKGVVYGPFSGLMGPVMNAAVMATPGGANKIISTGAPTAAQSQALAGGASSVSEAAQSVSAPFDSLRSMEQQMQGAGWNVQGLQQDGAGYSVAGEIDQRTGQPRRIMVQPTGEMVRQNYEQRMGISQMGTQARPGQRFSQKGQAIMDRTPSHTVSAAANSGQVISGQKRMPNGDLVEDAIQLPGADRQQHVVEYDPRFDTTRREVRPDQYAANNIPQNASKALMINPAHQVRDAKGNPAGPTTAYAVNPGATTASAAINNRPGSAQQAAVPNIPRTAMPSSGAAPTQGAGAVPKPGDPTFIGPSPLDMLATAEETKAAGGVQQQVAASEEERKKKAQAAALAAKAAADAKRIAVAKNPPNTGGDYGAFGN